jgi:hypothetical protein
MTLSSERRTADQETALRIMAADVADMALFRMEWPRADPRFANLAPTTWVQLQERRLVTRSPVQNELRYLLTEAGWIAGLRLNGTLDEEAFRGRCIEFTKVLKSLIKGRQGEWPASIHYQKLPADFPFGWVLNVLKSGLLQAMFPSKQMNAYWEKATASVRVPQTFDMPID